MRAPAVGLLLLLCCCAAAVRAIEPGQRAESWSLLSSEGMEIDFPRIAEGRAALLLLLGPRCGDCSAMFAALQGLREEFANHQVEVYVVGAADAAGLEATVGAGHDFVLVPDGAEVGVQYGTDGEQNILFEVLDRRYRDMLPTILLANQSKDGLKQFLGERAYDRLTETGRIVAFEWESYRPHARMEVA